MEIRTIKNAKNKYMIIYDDSNIIIYTTKKFYFDKEGEARCLSCMSKANFSSQWSKTQTKLYCTKCLIEEKIKYEEF